MLRLIAKGVEKRPKAIVLAVLVITIIISASLIKVEQIEEIDEDGKTTTRTEVGPALEFKTDIDKFLPENKLVLANQRVQEKFGADFLPHIIYAEAINSEENIFTPQAIREMYRISYEAQKVDGVEGSLGIADLINELVKVEDGVRNDWVNLLRPGYGGVGYYVSDEKIQDYLDLMFGILNGSLNLTEFSELLGENQLLDLIDEIDFIFEMIQMILTEDYTVESQKAKGTLIIIQLNGSLSSVEASEVAGSIRDTVEMMKLSQVKTRQTSQYLLSYDINENSIYTFQFLAVGIFGLIIFILFISFRKVSYVIIPVITLFIATIWTIGTMY
jgi:predicted RND superfamily exporter protein